MSGRSDNIFVGRGAGGGPRGIGAAGAQILVNFLVNYDRGRLAQLTSDVKKFEAERDAAAAKTAGINQKLVQLEKQVTDARRTQTIVGKANATTLNAIATSQTRINSLTQKARVDQAAFGKELANEKALRDRNVAALAAQTGLSDKQIRNGANLVSLERQLQNASLDRKANAQQILDLEQRIANVKRQQGALGGAGATGISRIGALGLGLLGGTIGGALVSGAILGPLQAAQDAVVTLFQNLLDGAKGSKEAVAELGKEIEELATSEDITRLEAATRLIERMRGTGAAAQTGAGPLAQAGEVAAIQAQVKGGQQLLDIIAGVNAIQGRTTEELNRQNVVFGDLVGKSRAEQEQMAGALGKVEAIVAFQRDWGNLIPLSGMVNFNDIANQILGVTDETVASTRTHALALAAAAAQAEREAAALREAAAAAADLRNELVGAAVEAMFDSNIDTLRAGLESTTSFLRSTAEADIDGIRQRAENAIEGIQNGANRRIDALQERMGNLELTPSRRTHGLEGQLDALKDAGPSKRTKELADQIERLNAAQEKAAYRTSLASIAEQRHQILLRERLRLTRDEINLEDFKGADRLIAIDALLARMQEQNEAQDRFNKLLDIQYQMQQGVRRQQGETIRDFIARRAQYYRGLLQQAAELNREGPQKELEAEKQRVEASIALKELEERRRKLVEDRARSLRMKDLAEQLRASQDRDRKELESRRESLQKQLEASRKADQAALESRREALQKQIEAVREHAAESIQKVNETRDREIAAREEARDRAIEAARVSAEKAIESEQARAEAIKRLSDQAEAARLASSLSGARSMAELQWFAGQLAGSQYALGFLISSGQFYTMDPNVRADILNNLFRAVTAYSQRLKELGNAQHGFQAPGAGYAEGGIVRLNNSNTPLNGDVRWGDGQGDELGMSLGHGLGAILSNKVAQELRNSRGNGALMGDVIFQTQDPYRDRYKFERTVREIVRSELN